jgi:hypothetical protein
VSHAREPRLAEHSALAAPVTDLADLTAVRVTACERASALVAISGYAAEMPAFSVIA